MTLKDNYSSGYWLQITIAGMILNVCWNNPCSNRTTLPLQTSDLVYCFRLNNDNTLFEQRIIECLNGVTSRAKLARYASLGLCSM